MLSARKKDTAPTPEVQTSNDSETATIYDETSVKIIKDNVSVVWARVKESKNLNQTGLALALNITQSSISKLLNSPKKPATAMTLHCEPSKAT